MSLSTAEWKDIQFIEDWHNRLMVGHEDDIVMGICKDPNRPGKHLVYVWNPTQRHWSLGSGNQDFKGAINLGIHYMGMAMSQANRPKERLWHLQPAGEPGHVRLICESEWLDENAASALFNSLSPEQQVHRFLSSVTKSEIQKHLPTLTFVQ